jgi:hypothetical protein
VATGSNQATVTFELTSSIKSLISTLTLAYGQFLDSNALSFTITIPPESIPEGAPGNITVNQLDSDINYQFKLRTVIGLFYTYESDVAYLDAITETTTTSDMTTTDAVNDNDTTTLRVTGTTTAPPGPTTPGRPTTPSTTVAPTTPGAITTPTTPGAVNNYSTTATEAISTNDISSLAPTILEVVPTTSGSIMVNWTKLEGASGYVVRYFDETGDLDGFKSVSLPLNT